MRLLSIKCNNYRQYKDLELKFSHKKEFDIHIIEASNGVGKTNLLNALNWCLYGDEPHKPDASVRDSGSIHLEVSNDSLPIYNVETLKEVQSQQLENLTVQVDVVIEKNGVVYTFERKQIFSSRTAMAIGRNIVSCSYRANTGETIFIESTDDVSALVESMLPQNIREYFYFDGEQLLNYFDDSKKKNIKENVYGIAQINGLAKVRKHITNVLADYKKELGKINPAIQKKQAEIQKIEEEYNSKLAIIQKTKAEIKIAEQEIKKANSFISGRERVADKNEVFESNKKLLENYKNNLCQLYQERENLIKKYTPLIFLYKTNKSVNEYVEQRAKKDDTFVNIRPDDIRESLQSCKCKLCGDELSDKQILQMQHLLERLQGNVSVQKITAFAPKIRKALIIQYYAQEKESILNSIEQQNQQIKELEVQNDILYQEIVAFGDGALNDITLNMQKKKDFENKRIKCVKDLGIYETHAQELANILKKAKNELDGANKEIAKKEVLARYAEFAQNAQQIIDKVINDIANFNRNNIAERTNQVFQQLIWKKNTYSRIELSEEYSLKLYSKEDNLSCLDSCSAAERELLALAFTLAVHEVSGFNSFLLIDTPVGRVSDMNRNNFAQVLLDVSKTKQIILAVTPSEYSDELKKIFNFYNISSYNKLSLKDNIIWKEEIS